MAYSIPKVLVNHHVVAVFVPSDLKEDLLLFLNAKITAMLIPKFQNEAFLAYTSYIFATAFIF